MPTTEDRKPFDRPPRPQWTELPPMQPTDDGWLHRTTRVMLLVALAATVAVGVVFAAMVWPGL